MGYYIDLKKISVTAFKEILRTSDLIPSWMVLKDNIDKNFDTISSHNIHNLEELKAAIKNKGKVLEFSNMSGLPENYLAVLRRVVNGYHPKPNRIKDFRGIPPDVVEKLEKLGIKNTRKLYPEVVTKSQRKAFSKISNVSPKEIMKLTRLADLSRIRWVGHTFAYVLLEAGYDSAEKVANADYQELYHTIMRLNREREIYKGNIGVNDMKLCVEAAAILDFEVEY